MLIEVIGCSSSGKTTFLKELQYSCKESGMDIYFPENVITSSVVSKLPRDRIIKAILVDSMLMPFIIAYALKNIHLWLRYLIICLKRPDDLYTRLNVFRNYIKKISMYYYLRKTKHNNKIIIFDEGPFHGFASLFAYYQSPPETKLVKKYLEHLLTCDLIVFLDVSEVIIAERAMRRNDPPWKGLNSNDWIELKRNTDMVYDLMLHGSSFENGNQLLRVEGPKYDIEKVVKWLKGRIDESISR